MEGFFFYFPEIFTLFHVMLHILKESLAGVFDVPYDRYETFEEGLMRYRLLVLCTTDAEREQVRHSLSMTEAIKKIEAEDVDPYRREIYITEYDKYGYFSDCDKFEISEKLMDPIRNKKKLLDDEDEEDEEKIFEEF